MVSHLDLRTLSRGSPPPFQSRGNGRFAEFQEINNVKRDEIPLPRGVTSAL